MSILLDLQFDSRFENVKIHYDLYEAEKNVQKVVVLILHGMAEHKGRYREFARYLMRQGISVAVSSHRGHKGAACKADYGYMGSDGLHMAMEDAHDLMHILRDRYPGYTYVLMGHSMGTIIARMYLRSQYANDIDMLVLSGAPSSNPAAGIAAKLAKMIGVCKGNKHRSPLINTLAFGSMSTSFVKKGDKSNGFEWLSKNEENVARYIADDACGFLFSVQSYHDLFSGMVEVYTEYPKTCINKTLPIAFFSGKEDPCGGFGEGIVKASEHMRTQGFENVTVQLYPTLRHEILLEVEKDLIFEDIKDFIVRNVSKK
ncbi:MAG: alpha/beta hydrolase [Erysipelotrichales bacterium]|nr:alpha/beta hydrolase [Erysipelotrichales bacterium]